MTREERTKLYIAQTNAKNIEIEALQKELKKLYAEREKLAGYLRPQKSRGFVKQIGKYKYIFIK